MKVILIGGHLSPALCVIEELQKDTNIVYIGRKHAFEADKAISLEYETIKKMGIPFVELTTGRLQRSFSLQTIPSLLKIPYGFFQSLRILKKQKPDVVVGFGGYLSYPVILASHFLKIPIIIHEQTMDAGVSNKRVAKYADKICISFESSLKYFPRSKTSLTGNPVRKSVFKSSGKSDKFNLDEPTIYITGGSTGSHSLNKIVMETLPKILGKASIIHQTGSALDSSDYNRLEILKDGLNNDKKDKYLIAKNFEPEVMGEIYNKASLVVGRSGINTVSELILLEKPGLMIPLTTAQKNEQLKNAAYLKKIGLGEYIDQKNIAPEYFVDRIFGMLPKIDKYKLNSNDIPFSKNSAKKIVKIIYETSQESSN